MRCARRHNPMEPMRLLDDEATWDGWHCLVCGDLIDPVIVRHRSASAQ